MKWTSVVFLAGMAGLGSLQGCSVAGPRESPLPKSGPKMIDIYERHAQETSARVDSAQAERPLRRYDEPARGSAAGSGGPDGRFSRLPNPDLEMYVYPHLAKGKYPIPGYTTVFPMFESVQYALPGELPPPAPALLAPTTD